MKVAGKLVMFFKRRGGQMKFSRKGESLPAGRSVLQEVQRFAAQDSQCDRRLTHVLDLDIRLV